MKKIKNIISFVVISTLALNSVACSNKQNKKDKDDDKHNNDGIEIEIESTNKDKPDAENIVNDSSEEDLTQSYYDYIRDRLLPDGTPTDICSSFVIPFQTLPIHQDMEMTTRYGILSADVRDYNGDGIQDLVTYSVDNVSYDQTSTGVVMSSWNGFQGDYLAITARFYTIENGEIVCKDEVPAITELCSDSVGYMIYGVYEDNGIPYIYGSCNSETRETYAPRKLNIYHIQGDSFVFDMTKGFYGFGQASIDGDPNVLAGTENTDFSLTALGTATTKITLDALTSSDCEISGSVLGGINIIFYESMDQVQATFYDVSCFREVIANDISALDARPSMPVFEPPKNVVPEEDAKALVERISANSGVQIDYVNFSTIDGGGSRFDFTAPDGITFILRYNADGILTNMESDFPTINPTSNWYAIKDAALTDSELNIDPSVYESFLGNCEWNQVSQSNDSHSITCARMDNCFWVVTFK